MLPLAPSTRPYLRIRRPSPTTAEFIVSSHPPMATLRQHALYATIATARLVLAAGCVLFLYLNLLPVDVGEGSGEGGQKAIHHDQKNHDQNHDVGDITSSQPAHHIFTNNEHHYHYHHHYQHRQDYTNDSFYPLVLLHQVHTLIHALTLSTAPTRRLAQLAPTFSPWLAASIAGVAVWLASLRLRTTETLLVLRGLGVQVQGRFIPTSKILDILINEAFLGFEVRYYLAVIVEGEDDVIIAFPTLLPGRDVVEAVWRGVRGCLWEGDLVRRAGNDK